MAPKFFTMEFYREITDEVVIFLDSFVVPF